MESINDVEQRIGQALDRIGTAFENVHAAAGVTELQDALAAERAAKVQLEEHVRSLGQKTNALEAKIQELKDSEEGAKGELERFQASMDPLREKAASADEAQELSRSMQSKLDKLSSIREADRAELDGILGELRKLLEVKASA